ncbi:hypothetical protein [Synechococcus sp. UW179A]|uniref:hypothetical protein n=1 Tax=Synechococcus sp. UW179A TaxID=2575510 RepID=UPI0010BF4B9E|nr:hypothetical protein [Synechococcus sp. UW179A]
MGKRLVQIAHHWHWPGNPHDKVQPLACRSGSITATIGRGRWRYIASPVLPVRNLRPPFCISTSGMAAKPEGH